jgi:hypothetical protein
MRYEYDQSVAQLKEGRVGLEQYRGLVERVTRQVSANRSHVQKLEAETKAYLKVGDRATAAKFALELQKAKGELAANEQQLQMHETAYGNNLKKIPARQREADRAAREDYEIRRRAEDERGGSEIAKLSETFDMNLTTDFGENRAGDSAEDRSEPRQGARRRGPVRKGYRRNQGRRAHAGRTRRTGAARLRSRTRLRSPETTPVAQTAKDLGPAAERTAEKTLDKQTS